ncbi:nuclear-pore anchor isoform X1 [Solanum pennellii]|uniref:Nuclear-pore anchor isoform X1 n=1 Tax=Solanum pennellii TaxID=28526 RepID=A0ABM1H1B6_SOLPN|nr:nuclear-pore anchor isoform X1 [Solanum pennellii]
MPLFISDEEYERCSQDAGLVAVKADEFIRDLYNQLENVKAQADAASITAEQTCSVLEQKYVSLSSEYSALQLQYSQLNSSFEERLSELSQAQAEKQQAFIQSIGKDGDVDRLSTEASELRKTKRQLMELVEQKDLEISEKNSTIKSYLDKIVHLTDIAANREVRVCDLETEVSRCQASCSRLLQEKELVERHNAWLNDELTTKVNGLMELRKAHSELEADISAKLVDAEKKISECDRCLKRKQEQVREMELKFTSLEQDLLSAKDVAAAKEDQMSGEIATLNKLVELYKESSEEWSKKAGELEGVIKALETHGNQIENDYKERLEKEVSAKIELKEEVACLKNKLAESEAELKKGEDTLKLLPLSYFSSESLPNSAEAGDMVEDDRMVVPSLPIGVSGTALAASLLREGWSLSKMYTKYQETVDALRHEQLGRKQAQDVLERVLCEIEEKAGVILDERAEHQRLEDAYSVLSEKLQHSLSQQAALERNIQEFNADMRRRDRDYAVAQAEIVDLQEQVTVLLKECRDIQLRGGSVGPKNDKSVVSSSLIMFGAESNADDVGRLLSYKDINGLVEQNVQLRGLVRSLTDQIENRESELKEKYEKELQKHVDKATSQVDAVLAKADEQATMIKSLHASVAMYKKLFEEHTVVSSDAQSEKLAEVRRPEVMLLPDSSHEVLGRAQERAFERVKCLEEELSRLRSEIISLRSERDKSALEAQFARDKLARYMKDFELQKEEHNGVITRNVEFSQLVVDYQKKLRESYESLNAAEELSQKLKLEVSILKDEKGMLVNAEKRASDEVRNLSQRVHSLQVHLDTLQSTENVRDEARAAERRKQEEYIKLIEKEWAEAKKELQEQRDNVRNLIPEREDALKNALRQIEEMRKELTSTSHSVAAAEARVVVAEARSADLEEKLQAFQKKVSERADEGGPSSSTELFDNMDSAEEVKRLREEVQVNKNHMLQYKSIAQANEEALKQMELAYENLKVEADRVKKSMEEEALALRKNVDELERECNLKSIEAASATAGKEEAVVAALAEISSLKEDTSAKTSQISNLEAQITALKDDLDKEHQRWRAAQDNYERQVILQSETIQELTRTSQALATLQEESSELRKLSDVLKSENNALKAKWEAELSVLEVSKTEAEKKYTEANEQNKILLDRLEGLYIKLAEKDRVSSGVSAGSTVAEGDDGLMNVVNYLRRSKEIAETEISLLRQEKLRLQSQLENALRRVEVAEASLNSERESSRAQVLSEEEFKTLQLQVRELNLLRESNLQLREENKHNVEECQKLRQAAQKMKTELEDLEKLLNERQADVEACRKGIEMQKLDKEKLERRVSELVERYKNFDLEEYASLKEAASQMQVNLREKNEELEKVKKAMSEQQNLLADLEQDLSRSRTELSQRESRINEILQTEASLRSDVDKHKKLTGLMKKRVESNLLKEKERADSLSKEKDDLARENQALSKQLEDAKQGKKTADAADEQALKDKEKEKNTRIQGLEKITDRLREELKQERSKRLKMQKTIGDSYGAVNQQRSKLSDEIDKHKQALKMLTDEVEKIRQTKGSQTEGTSVDQLLSGTHLDDFTAAYLQAVDDFERVARNELGVSGAGDASAPDASLSASVVPGPAATLPPPASLVTSIPAVGKAEEERRLVLSKITSETRKTGRKLVRPRITKPEEPLVDVEMQDTDESTNSRKHLPPQKAENFDNATLPTQPPIRKRLSAASTSSTSELQEETPAMDETCLDVAQPVLKKSKHLEAPQEGSEDKSVDNVENSESLPTTEEHDAGDETQGLKEEASDIEKDETTLSGEQVEEPLVVATNQAESQVDRTDIADDTFVSSNEVSTPDNESTFQVQQESEQLAMDEREEGELIADPEDVGNLDSILSMGSPENLEPQTDDLAGTDEELLLTPTDPGEIESSQLPDDDKNDEVDATEELAESSEKLNDGGDQVAAETDQALDTVTGEKPSSSPVDSSNSKEGGLDESAAAETEEGKQVSPINRSSRTINLNERARERASIRQAAMLSATPARGRGRVLRRGGRSGRGGRGPNSGSQG